MQIKWLYNAISKADDKYLMWHLLLRSFLYFITLFFDILWEIAYILLASYFSTKNPPTPSEIPPVSIFQGVRVWGIWGELFFSVFIRYIVLFFMFNSLPEMFVYYLNKLLQNNRLYNAISKTTIRKSIPGSTQRIG
jgi:hypothetical protein